MSESRERIVSREVPAVEIPSGAPVTIPEGSRVHITQTLGGSFTVMTDTGLARISGEHADAIGETAHAHPATAADAARADAPSEEQLWAQLRNVYDPEIPVNIVDLGLVYSLEVQQPTNDDGYTVEMQMTLTAPGCGMGPAIAEDARNKLMLVPGVDEANVNLVWEPPWNQTMISEEGRMKLGLI
ncbi:MAG: putative Fe-S cluster assembly protein SufT [Opitutaceae bacterium]